MGKTKNINSYLIEISDIDKQIASLVSEKSSIEDIIQKMDQESKRRQVIKDNTKEELDSENGRRMELEGKIKEEEEKIIERHKKLSSIGGVRAAKVAERETEASNKRIKELDENLQEIAKFVAVAQKKYEIIEKACEEIDKQLSDEVKKCDPVIQKIDKDLQSLEKDKDSKKADLKKKNSIALALYEKLSKRYKEGVVCQVERKSCNKCFRFLPEQLYNQALEGGELLQCPGCNRVISEVLDGDVS